MKGWSFLNKYTVSQRPKRGWRLPHEGAACICAFVPSSWAEPSWEPCAPAALAAQQPLGSREDAAAHTADLAEDFTFRQLRIWELQIGDEVSFLFLSFLSHAPWMSTFYVLPWRNAAQTLASDLEPTYRVQVTDDFEKICLHVFNLDLPLWQNKSYLYK